MNAYADTETLHRVLSDNEFKSLGTARNIDRCLRLASLKIDEATFGRIKGAGFKNLTPFQRDCVINACCYQALKVNDDGFDDDNLQSYSVGDISITEKETDGEAARLGLSAEAFAYLNRSGLMQRVI